MEADIEVYLGDQYLKLVQNINLPEFFITSNAEAKSMINNDKFFKQEDTDDIAVSVKKAEGKKCSRCWKILEASCTRTNCGLKN